MWDSGPLSAIVRRFRNWEKQGGKGWPHPVSGPRCLLSLQCYLLSWLVATGVDEFEARTEDRIGEAEGGGREKGDFTFSWLLPFPYHRAAEVVG